MVWVAAEAWVGSPPAQWVKDPALLQLWLVETAAEIQSLAWAFPCVVRVTALPPPPKDNLEFSFKMDVCCLNITDLAGPLK